MQKWDDLKIWNKAMDTAENNSLLSAQFPSEERSGLTSQLRRSAVSVPINITEATGRSTSGELRNSVSIARVSSHELLTQLILSNRLNKNKGIQSFQK